MKRWIALLFLLGPCGGCAVFEDVFFDPLPMQTQPNTCGMPAPPIQQTAEPPLR